MKENNRRRLGLTAEEMRLVARHVALDDSMSASEVRALRALRDSVDLARWNSWLDMAREEKPETLSVTTDKSPRDTLLHRLEVARGAALLAAALAGDAARSGEALGAAERHLRDFASVATEFIENSSSREVQGQEKIPTFRDAFAQHLRARSSSSLLARNESSFNRRDQPRPSFPVNGISTRSKVLPTHDPLYIDFSNANIQHNKWSSSLPRRPNKRFQAWR